MPSSRWRPGRSVARPAPGALSPAVQALLQLGEGRQSGALVSTLPEHDNEALGVLGQGVASTPSTASVQHSFVEGEAALVTWMVLSIAIGTVMTVWGLVLVCRKPEAEKADERSSLGPSIVVYPSYHGQAPQLLPSRDISFRLPPAPAAKLRQSSSLDAMDLLGAEDQSPGGTASRSATPGPTQTLAAPVAFMSQRSNSFSGCPLGSLDPALYRVGASDLEEEMLFPEDHLGRLWFCIQYEPTAEKLQVTLIKAKNLQSRTVATANNCDPIVRLHLIPDERRHLQSRQKKKTCNPVFDEVFVFQVPSKDLEDHVLRMTVVDTGRNKRRAVIGHVSFPLSRLTEEDAVKNADTVYKMDLEKETPEAKSDLGEMLVSLLYNENLHRLTVTVIEARRIKFREDRPAGPREVYVRVVLQQHHGQVKVKRTGVVRCADDSPNFSECFYFQVPAASIDVTSLSLQLEQPSARYGRGHKLIGKCVLGSYMFARGKALTHWNTAFGNPMQQVQQWHSLSV